MGLIPHRNIPGVARASQPRAIGFIPFGEFPRSPLALHPWRALRAWVRNVYAFALYLPPMRIAAGWDLGFTGGFDFMAGLVIRPRARILHGHDWVYATEVLKTFGSPEDGGLVSLKDGRDKLLGTAIYNSKSQIVARRISRRRQVLDADFFTRRITQAAEFRDRMGCRKDLRRVVWSESDGLPGVIVDQYDRTLVLQTLTLAMDRHKELIAEVLMQTLGAAGVIERNDAPVRALEGMQPSTGALAGDPVSALRVEIDGVFFDVDLAGGQKTGFYLDQADSYRAVAAHAHGKRVLDCFANQGGFALACARAGAREVIAVEAGAESCERLEHNSRTNALSVQCVRADVFDFLKTSARSDEKFDLIILDPPSFTKAKGKVTDALRGYRELHLRAGELLAPDGLLATFSCSHHVDLTTFSGVVADGLMDARRSARVIGEFRQAADHPVVLHLPETSYLKGLLLAMMPGR